MSTTTAIPAADQAAVDRIRKCFAAFDKIAASAGQTAARRSDAETQFLDSLLSGNFDAAGVLTALKAWKQQDEQFNDQLNALKEAENRILEFLKRQMEDKSPALKDVLIQEENRLREQIGKSRDQAETLRTRLDKVCAWLAEFDKAGEAQPKKGGVAAGA